MELYMMSVYICDLSMSSSRYLVDFSDVVFVSFFFFDAVSGS